MSQNFITYGCWNKGACSIGNASNGVSAVITEMDVRVSQMEIKPSFVAVAGDNYYPKIDEATATTPKKKYFNESELKSGFACLRDFQRKHNVPIDIIGGNHDTENTLDFEIITSSGSRSRSRRQNASAAAATAAAATYKKNGCLITRTEINMAKSAIMTFTMFNCRLFGTGNHTLILMLDSNIYIENMTKLKDCYLPLLRNTVRHLRNSRMYPAELNVSAFAAIIQDAVAEVERATAVDGATTVIVETLRSVQLAWVNHILEAATRIGSVKNVVIIAHHPLAYYKIKKGKLDFQTGTNKDDAEYLKLCHRIYGHFASAQYFYSCADLHTYQAGTVVLGSSSAYPAGPIIINQQIAGTGGTTLEKEYATVDSVRGVEQQTTSTVVVGGITITYNMSVAIHSHGYLHWTETPESLSVEFIPVRLQRSSGSPESPGHAGGTPRRHCRRRRRTRTVRHRKMYRNRSYKMK